jgi:hypothetical protein
MAYGGACSSLPLLPLDTLRVLLSPVGDAHTREAAVSGENGTNGEAWKVVVAFVIAAMASVVGS